MALTIQRDLDALRTGIERWLDRSVGTLRRAAPGYSCETIVVDDEIVVRLPPAGDGIFPGYHLAQQGAVQDAAGQAGVPVAGPCRVESDESFLGATFVAMPFIDGAIPGELTAADPWLLALDDDGQRRTVWEGFIDVLATIHRTPTTGLELRDGLTAEVDWWDDYAQWSADGAPPAALVEVLAWCRSNQPTTVPPGGLLWGDVRYGNVIFDRSSLRPAAVLDWDMASVGPFELDLAWVLALDGVQAQFVSSPLPGFGDREAAIARCASNLGRTLHDLRWYEVFALVRASAIATRISVLQTRAGQRPMFAPGGDPTLDAARRTIERL